MPYFRQLISPREAISNIRRSVETLLLAKISDNNMCYIILGDINFGRLMRVRIDSRVTEIHYTHINQLRAIALCNSIHYHVSSVSRIFRSTIMNVQQQTKYNV